MAAAWGSYWVLERNRKLSPFGYLVYALMLISALLTLVFPFANRLTDAHPGCPVQSLTGFPCPTCGYTRALMAASEGEFMRSLLWNPLWIVQFLFIILLIAVAARSLVLSRATRIRSLFVYLLAGLLVINWVLKLIVGPEYY